MFGHNIIIFTTPKPLLQNSKKDGITRVELSYEHSSALLARSEDHIETGKKFAEYLKDIGISVTQGHLAFPTSFCTNDDSVKRLVREIELFCAIGIENAVLHCDYMKGEDIVVVGTPHYNKMVYKLFAAHSNSDVLERIIEN